MIPPGYKYQISRLRIDPSFIRPSRIVSAFVVGTVGLLSKSFLRLFCRFHPLHLERLHNAFHRPRDVAVISYSNHNSTMDDPLLWGALPVRYLVSQHSMRWSLTAHDICFTNPVTRWFFSHGKSLPAIRGAGIFQPTLNHALDLLNKQHDWIHVFPEAKVNDQPPTLLPFKWGIGRLITEAECNLIILPMYHCGMERVKPYDSWLPRLFQHVTLGVGEPIDARELLRQVREHEGIKDLHEVRSRVTRLLRDRLDTLRHQVQQEHDRHLANNRPHW